MTKQLKLCPTFYSHANQEKSSFSSQINWQTFSESLFYVNSPDINLAYCHSVVKKNISNSKSFSLLLLKCLQFSAFDCKQKKKTKNNNNKRKSFLIGLQRSNTYRHKQSHAHPPNHTHTVTQICYKITKSSFNQSCCKCGYFVVYFLISPETLSPPMRAGRRAIKCKEYLNSLKYATPFVALRNLRGIQLVGVVCYYCCCFIFTYCIKGILKTLNICCRNLCTFSFDKVKCCDFTAN